MKEMLDHCTPNSFDIDMRRILAVFFSFTSLFLLHSALYGAWADNLTMPEGDFSAMKKTGSGTVTEVVNPLTVKLKDGRFIHLAGLDFPDLDFYEPGDLSVTAQKILDDFLKNRNVIIYQTPSKEEGRMNRMGHHIAHLARADDAVLGAGVVVIARRSACADDKI